MQFLLPQWILCTEREIVSFYFIFLVSIPSSNRKSIFIYFMYAVPRPKRWMKLARHVVKPYFFFIVPFNKCTSISMTNRRRLSLVNFYTSHRTIIIATDELSTRSPIVHGWISLFQTAKETKCVCPRFNTTNDNLKWLPS